MSGDTAEKTGITVGASGNDSAVPGRVLVTFDVDGTLVKAVDRDANRLHKRAFSHAFKEVFGVEGHIDVIQHHGSTDQLVARDVLHFYGISHEDSTARMPAIMAAMNAYAQQNACQAGDGLKVLPGVTELLQELAGREDVVVGLVTGNLEPIAWMKMESMSLLPHFSIPRIGGFGSDATDRGHLVTIARRRAEERLPGPPFVKHLHVGDTPNDIRAALAAGATPVGVLTGIFDRLQLESAAAEYEHGMGELVIYDNLQGVDEFLNVCTV